MKKEKNKSSLSIDYFYKQIDTFDSGGNPIKHNIFDYLKIWYDEDNGKNILLYFIISERGLKAKTTQAKMLSKWVFDNYRTKTMWTMNTKELIKKEKESHLNKVKKFHPELFPKDDEGKDKVIIKGNNVYHDYKNKENGWYCRMSALSVAENEKGSRDDYELFIYDEYNVGDTNIKSQKTNLLSSLFATLDDPINSNNPDAVKLKKIIIHGNNTSLNDQLLIDLGIYSITEEVTDIVVNGRIIGRIICPMFDDEQKLEIKERNSDNPLFLLQEALGKADHVYLNENLHDELNNVNAWMSLEPYIQNFYLKIKKQYFEVRIIEIEDKNTGEILPVAYVLNTLKKDVVEGNLFAMNRNSVEEKIRLNSSLKRNLLKFLGEDLIYFSAPFVREMIVKEIVK